MTASGKWKFECLVLSYMKILPLRPFAEFTLERSEGLRASFISLKAKGYFRSG